MTARPDPDLERGRLAAERVKAEGGSAMDAADAWIKTSFDETARQNTLRERAERLRALQFKTCPWPCCAVNGQCCGCC
jgi:hypothetical protein